MSPMVRRAGYRHLLRHPWQMGLALLGIALGVAVVVSVDLANESARRAFRLSTETVTGRATHQIVGGPSGVPEELYARLTIGAGVDRAAPVVEGYATSRTDPPRTLRILGVDPLVEAPFRPYLSARPGGAGPEARPGGAGVIGALLTRPDGCLLTPETAADLAVEPGETFTVEIAGRSRRLRLVGRLLPGERLARQALRDLIVVDVSTAQELLERPGRLDRIDLIVRDDREGAATLDAVRGALPSGCRLRETGLRTETGEGMIRAFRVNLSALSLLALVCGSFLIYNAMAFSVVQRRKTIGTLRALGVTRREILLAVVGEALILGVAGTAAGIAGGVLLAGELVGLVARTINDLYFAVSVREIVVPTSTILKAVALGTGATLVASAAPAREATSTSPRAALSRSFLEARTRLAVPRLAGAGGAGLLVGAAVIWIAERSLTVTFLGLFLVVVGFALLAPAATWLAASALRPALRRLAGLLGGMAARGVTSSLSRTATAVAALMIALSVIVGVGVMIDSFRTTVARWLEASLTADLYLTSPGPASDAPEPSLAPEAVQRIATLPGVDGITTVRRTDLPGEVGPIRLVVFDLDPRGRRGFRFLEGDPAAAWSRFDDDVVLLTEAYAARNDLGVGSTIDLPTDDGRRRFRVAGVYASYVSDRGAVVMSRPTYRRHWRDPLVTGLSVYAAPDADLEELADAIRRRLDDPGGVLVQSNRALRESSLQIFDRTFRITLVLRLLVALVAFVGVLGALMALQLERSREMGVLRATGLTPAQVRRLIASETGLMGLIAASLSIPVGLVLAAIMVHVVNRRSFGWSLEMVVDPWVLLQTVALGIVAALAAGVVPAYRMSRVSPAAALREE